MSDLALIGKNYFYLYHIFFNTRPKIAKMATACNFLSNNGTFFENFRDFFAAICKLLN